MYIPNILTERVYVSFDKPTTKWWVLLWFVCNLLEENQLKYFCRAAWIDSRSTIPFLQETKKVVSSAYKKDFEFEIQGKSIVLWQ